MWRRLRQLWAYIRRNDLTGMDDIVA